MSGLLRAARYLTILPLGAETTVPPAGLGRAAGWFPVVGAGVGLLLIGVERGAAPTFPPLLVAVMTVTAWKVVTGGLHLDGLADCLDGLGGRTPEHRRAIMSDSRIGSFGVIGIALLLMLEAAALSGIDPGTRWRVLLAAPVVGRATPPLLARVWPPAPGGGQGAAFAGEVGGAATVVALLLAGGVALAVLGTSGLMAFGAALAVALLAARFLATRVGGITGDVFGAAVELAELTVLLTVAGWPGAQH